MLPHRTQQACMHASAGCEREREWERERAWMTERETGSLRAIPSNTRSLSLSWQTLAATVTVFYSLFSNTFTASLLSPVILHSFARPLAHSVHSLSFPGEVPEVIFNSLDPANSCTSSRSLLPLPSSSFLLHPYHCAHTLARRHEFDRIVARFPTTTGDQRRRQQQQHPPPKTLAASCLVFPSEKRASQSAGEIERSFMYNFDYICI